MGWLVRSRVAVLLGVSALGLAAVLMRPSDDAKSSDPQDAKSKSAGVAESAGPVIEDPGETVTRFLNALKSGDGPTIESLLTSTARTQLPKYHMKVEPLGSNEARFTIVSVKRPKDKKKVAYVACTWQEPPAGGQPPESMEVVWIVRREANVGWRVSGMALESPTGSVIVFNFEDPPDMLRQKEALVKAYEQQQSGPAREKPAPAAATAARPAAPAASPSVRR